MAKVCRGPRSTSGLPLIGSRVKYLPIRGWGEYVGLDGITPRTTESSLVLFRNVRPSCRFVRALVGGNEDEGCPKHYGRLTLVLGQQHITDEGQHAPSMLQVVQHFPHVRAGEPVIQYFCINQGDWKGGHPVIDARISVPVYGYVIFHENAAGT